MYKYVIQCYRIVDYMDSINFVNNYNLVWQDQGRLRGLAVVCWTTDHYYPCSNLLAWAYLKVVSSLTSLHHLWRSLGPFNLPCAQKWRKTSIISIMWEDQKNKCFYSIVGCFLYFENEIFQGMVIFQVNGLFSPSTGKRIWDNFIMIIIWPIHRRRLQMSIYDILFVNYFNDN